MKQSTKNLIDNTFIIIMMINVIVLFIAPVIASILGYQLIAGYMFLTGAAIFIACMIIAPIVMFITD